MKTCYWLIKREYWEYRSGFLWTPLAVAAAFLLLNILGCVGFIWHAPRVNGMIIGKGHSVTGPEALFHLASLFSVVPRVDLFAAVSMIQTLAGLVTFFYVLGALSRDRRDRSILFWRSLPISDTSTVLSKLVAGGVLAPLIACLIGLLTGWVLIALHALTAGSAGLPVIATLQQAHPLSFSLQVLALLPACMLMSIPTLGWLLLCSASARKPLLWALIVPNAAVFTLGWFAWLGQVPYPFFAVAKQFMAQLLGGTFAAPISLLEAIHNPSPRLTNTPILPAPLLRLADPASVGQLDLALYYHRLIAPQSLAGLLLGALCIVLAIKLRGRCDAD